MIYCKDKKLIIENNIKFDILHTLYVNNNLTIYFTKKRIFNKFKRRYIPLYGLLILYNLSLELKLYLNCKSAQMPLHESRYICKYYKIFGLHNSNLIDSKKLIDVLNSYKIIKNLINF